MKVRPLSVTVTAWVLITMGLIAIGLTPAAWNAQLERRNLHWHWTGLLLTLSNLAAVFLGFVVDVPVDDSTRANFLFSLFLLCGFHAGLAGVYRLVAGVLGLALPPVRRYGGLGTIVIALLPWPVRLALNVLAVIGSWPWSSDRSI
jgi:hypothetical protein